MRIQASVNFYDLVRRDLDSRDYEEFMSVKKTDQDLKMLVRTDGEYYKRVFADRRR